MDTARGWSYFVRMSEQQRDQIRSLIVNVRLNPEEAAALHRLIVRERLRASQIIRRLVWREAERDDGMEKNPQTRRP